MIESKDKIKTIEKILHDAHVFIHLDSRVKGTSLPQSFTNQSHVTLQVSKESQFPLLINENELIAELLFSDGYFRCTIPWLAVWGATNVSGTTLLWPSEMPDEIKKTYIASSVDKADVVLLPSAQESSKAEAVTSTKSKIKKSATQTLQSVTSAHADKKPIPSDKKPQLKRIK